MAPADPALSALDGSAPWLAGWRTQAEAVASSVAAGLPLHEALNRAGADRVQMLPRFVPQSALAPGEAYENHIFHSNECPTREGLHDFWNGICWLHWPLTKRRLNHLHRQQLALLGVGGERGAVRDALTLLDENGALLVAPPVLWQALRARDWQQLFVDLRPLWAKVRWLPFGHALLEKLAQPRKAIAAHVLNLPLPEDAANASFDALDAWLTPQLQADWLATKPFVPLPVLGIPGWCAANDDPGYYQDSQVFRPAPPSNP